MKCVGLAGNRERGAALGASPREQQGTFDGARETWAMRRAGRTRRCERGENDAMDECCNRGFAIGEQPYEAQVGGKRHLLPKNGFAVKGPKIEQSLELVSGKAFTSIRTGSYSYTDAQ